MTVVTPDRIEPASATELMAERIAERILRVAIALPLALLAALLLTFLFLSGAAYAEPADNFPTCGTDLSTTLSEEQRLTIAEAAKAVPAGDQKFWTIEKEGVAPSFLLGTIHIADKRVTTLSEPIAEALDGADRLIVEVAEITDQRAAGAALFSNYQLLTLPDGQTLDRMIDPARYEKIKVMLDGKGIPAPLINTLQPWFIAMSVMLPNCAALQAASPADALDGSLVARMAERGGTVIGLETLEEQLRIISSMPMDGQIEQLVAVADFGGRMDDVMETMIALYIEGKIAAIMPTLEAAFPNGGMLIGAGESAEAFEKALIDERNTRMVTRMTEHLETGNSFVAVGALHLPGANGIVEMLRAQGWSVTPAG